MMGILLFGTEETKFRPGDESAGGGFEYPHCYLLSDLDVPAAADVKRLRSMANDEEESSKILVPSRDKVSMSNVLFCANHIFTTRAPNFTSRRLFLVTDNDNPHATSKELRASAAVRARDLYDLGVIIELFPISQPDQAFDRSKFYDVCLIHLFVYTLADLSRTSYTNRIPPIPKHRHQLQQPPKRQAPKTVSPCSTRSSQTLTPSQCLVAHCSQIYLLSSAQIFEYQSKDSSFSSAKNPLDRATYG